MGSDVLGVTGAAPIWHAIMQYAHDRDALPVLSWPRPSTVIDATVCKISGLLPTPDCPRIKELFLTNGAQSTVPQQTDFYYKRLTINIRTGLIATTSTPTNLRADRLFFDYPGPAREWAKAAGFPMLPTEFDSGGAQPTDIGVVLTSPAALSRVNGARDVTCTINVSLPKMVQSWTLAYGIGLNPRGWVNITASGSSNGTGITLGHWNTSGLDGLYTVRLQVLLTDRTVLESAVQVTVDNVPPTVALTAPQPGTSFAGLSVALAAEANDNLPDGMYVEFYHNGQLIDTVKQAPYTSTWRIDNSGQQSFYAIAYDSAGNSTRSSAVVVTTTH